MPEANTPAKAEKAASSKSPGDDLALSSDASKDRTKPSRPDHGEAPQWVKDQEKAQEAARKDPWGDTPAQYREDPPKAEGTAAALNGMDPHLDNNEHIVGGTLPPV